MYINLMNEQNKNTIVSYWLLSVILLVALMIVVGGLTRITDSGLSITEWNLFSGIIPPFTTSKWNYYFSLYKNIPEFKLINSSMTLNEFKIIFWWEYIHRLLGRIIGIFYLLPLIFFTFKYKITKKNILFLYFIFFLICLQGFLGWYMVKSGLTERTDVSHYRLSLHLSVAFVIIMLVFWIYLNFKIPNLIPRNKQIPLKLPLFLGLLVFLQISLGALVSGLDAGKIYQTWPLMNGNYFPDDSNFKDLYSLDFFNTPSILQFIHRNLAYAIVLLFLFLTNLIFKNSDFFHLRKYIKIIFIFLSIQIILGILTILSGAEMIYASMHQIGSIFLIISVLLLIHKNYLKSS